VGEIVHFAEEWVLPLLNDLRTPDELVKIYESDDPRVMKQQHWFIFIAAADVVLGKSKEALAVLEGAFCASGLRKRYAAAFESLTSKVHEGN
jgi:hypothetical protein